MKRYALFIIGLLAFCSVAQAGMARADLLAGELDAKGRPTKLIARFIINPGWHMYWTNPGESGLAPQLKWTAPAGMKIGQPKFPIPHRIMAGAGLTSFGYENELALIIPVEYENDQLPTEPVKVSIGYLVCMDVCLKENQQLQLDFGKVQAVDDKQLKTWESLLPAQAKQLKNGVVYSSDKTTGYLFAAIDDSMKDPEIFPPDAEFVNYEEAKREKSADGREELRLSFRVLTGIKKQIPDNAEAILAYTDKEGRRVGLSFRPDFGLKD